MGLVNKLFLTVILGTSLVLWSGCSNKGDESVSKNNDYEVVEEDSSSEDTLKTPKLFEKTEYGFNQYNDKGQLIKEVTGVKTHKFQYHDNGRVSIHFEEFIYQGNERKREIQYNDLGKEIRKTETHDFGIDGEIDKTEEHIYE